MGYIDRPTAPPAGYGNNNRGADGLHASRTWSRPNFVGQTVRMPLGGSETALGALFLVVQALAYLRQREAHTVPSSQLLGQSLQWTSILPDHPT